MRPFPKDVLAIVSFLLGTSSFILGLKIQSAAKAITESTPTSALSALTMHKYFELLILALVIPSVAINIFGILLVGSHLYLQDTPYLLVLFAFFIPAGAILFLLGKLRILYKDKDSTINIVRSSSTQVRHPYISVSTQTLAESPAEP